VKPRHGMGLLAPYAAVFEPAHSGFLDRGSYQSEAARNCDCNDM